MAISANITDILIDNIRVDEVVNVKIITTEKGKYIKIFCIYSKEAKRTLECGKIYDVEVLEILEQTKAKALSHIIVSECFDAVRTITTLKLIYENS